MDYKDKYEQALAKAREIHRNEDEKRFDMECLFPELKESEDEKVRKMLIKFFSNGVEYNSSTNGIFDKDIVAWLEKQGEHANFRNKIQIGDKVTCNEAGIVVNISQLNRIAKLRVAKPTTIDIDKMVNDYANNKERGNDEFGKPVPCMIRAYRRGINDALSALNLEKKLKGE